MQIFIIFVRQTESDALTLPALTPQDMGSLTCQTPDSANPVLRMTPDSRVDLLRTLAATLGRVRDGFL